MVAIEKDLWQRSKDLRGSDPGDHYRNQKFTDLFTHDHQGVMRKAMATGSANSLWREYGHHFRHFFG